MSFQTKLGMPIRLVILCRSSEFTKIILGRNQCRNWHIQKTIPGKFKSAPSGVSCLRMNMKIKGKVYRTVVRPALVYGAETWALKKAQEKKLEVAEMRMLRWMCGVTKLDKIKNERIRGTTIVGEITKKVQERRLKWYGHVMRREEHYVGRRAMVMKVQGRRKRGRPKRRWLDEVKDDIKEKGLSADAVYDRATWRRMSSYIDPT